MDFRVRVRVRVIVRVNPKSDWRELRRMIWERDGDCDNLLVDT